VLVYALFIVLPDIINSVVDDVTSLYGYQYDMCLQLCIMKLSEISDNNDNNAEIQCNNDNYNLTDKNLDVLLSQELQEREYEQQQENIIRVLNQSAKVSTLNGNKNTGKVPLIQLFYKNSPNLSISRLTTHPLSLKNIMVCDVNCF
jgi:hypothetical protein